MWFSHLHFGGRGRGDVRFSVILLCLCVFVAYWTLRMRIVAFTQVDRYFPSVNCMQSADNKHSIAQRVKRARASLFCSRRKRTGQTLAAFITLLLDKKYTRFLGFRTHCIMNWDNISLYNMVLYYLICFFTGMYECIIITSLLETR